LRWGIIKRKRFLNECKKLLTSLQYKNCIKYNDYTDFKDFGDFAVAGKKLNKFLSDYWKQEIIKCGISVSQLGKIEFKEAWKFDKNLNPKLKLDGSNFFSLAERIK
jgi:hypothetical protein